MSTLTNAQIQVNWNVSESSTANTAGSVGESFNLPYPTGTQALGTGSGQFNVQWSYTGTLASTTITFDLTALTGTTSTKTFGHVKALYLYNENATDTNLINIAPGATNGWTGPLGSSSGVNVNGTGILLNYAPLTGWTVDSTHKTITLTTTSTVTFVLAILGV